MSASVSVNLYRVDVSESGSRLCLGAAIETASPSVRASIENVIHLSHGVVIENASPCRENESHLYRDGVSVSGSGKPRVCCSVVVSGSGNRSCSVAGNENETVSERVPGI